MNILLTGATGFIGSALLARLAGTDGIVASAAVRSPFATQHTPFFTVGSLGANTNWSAALKGQQVVIHLAGRAHVLKEKTSADPLAEFRKVNVAGTLSLARQAAAGGVKRFIFISSIGVNGVISSRPFTEQDQPNPAGPYALSKWEAEQALWNLQRETGMELVIIRPPLTYGANAPGNFDALVKWVAKGAPLPLGAVHNKRTLIGLDNLVDLIAVCITHPAAANEVFLAGDSEGVSTTELLRKVGRAMGRKTRLVPVPAGLLVLAASLLGKQATAQRLLGSLQVDNSKARRVLGWNPPYSLEQGLRRCFDVTNGRDIGT